MIYTLRSGLPRFLLTVIILALAATAGAQSSSSTKTPTADSKSQVVHVLGLEGIKQNAKGKLTVSAGGLEFKSSSSHALVQIASIQDIFTSQDTRQTGGTGMTVAKMAVPYGGGRVISLFAKEKYDSLTLIYRDENDALHGVILTMPAGEAPDIKKQLVALGAKASVPVAETAATDDDKTKEKK